MRNIQTSSKYLFWLLIATLNLGAMAPRIANAQSLPVSSPPTQATLSIDRTTFVSGENVTLTFTISNPTTSISYLEITSPQDQKSIQRCEHTSVCIFTGPIRSPNGVTMSGITYVGTAYADDGSVIATTTSVPIKIRGSDDAPDIYDPKMPLHGNIQLIATTTTVTGGSFLQMHTLLSHLSVPWVYITLRTYDGRTGELIGACRTPNAECDANDYVVPYLSSYSKTFRYYVIATDMQGRKLGVAYSQWIRVKKPPAILRAPNNLKVSVTANKTTAKRGDTVTFRIRITSNGKPFDHWPTGIALRQPGQPRDSAAHSCTPYSIANGECTTDLVIPTNWYDLKARFIARTIFADKQVVSAPISVRVIDPVKK